LDVSKAKIDVAIAEKGREAARFWGTIPHEPGAVRKLMKRLGKPEGLDVCYEAGTLVMSDFYGNSLRGHCTFQNSTTPWRKN
jgi:hypothetical protein